MALSPRQLSALTRRWRESYDRQRYLSAMIASTTANWSYWHPKEPIAPIDFMPGYRRESAPEMDDTRLALSIHHQLAPRSIPKQRK